MASIVRPNREKPASPSRRFRNQPATFLLFAVVVIGCGFGMFSSVRRALAENWIANPTLESLEQAVRLTPRNGAGWVGLGRALVSREGQSARALDAIRKGVELGPYNPEAWISLALQAEAAGDPQAAEEHLLKAFAVDKGFESRWQLANFYLRRGNDGQFWRWIRETIAFAPRGFLPGVQLCWRAFDDPELILENAIPNDPEINRSYFEFTRATRAAEGRAAVGVWERLKPDLRPGDEEGIYWLIAYWQRLERPSEAVEVHNLASAAGIIPFELLSLTSGNLITNANLAQPPGGQGFDWKLMRSEDIQPEIESGGESSAGFVFHFSGTQSISSALVEQVVPVSPGSVYRFQCRYSSDALAENTGVRWTLYAGATRERVLTGTESLPASPDLQLLSLEVTAPPQGFITLALEYERFPGTTRKKGAFRTSHFAFFPASAGGQSEDLR